MKQNSISNSVSVSGKGLHTGREVTMTFHPAGTNHGIKFRRIDLEGQPTIPAEAQYVTTTMRSTTIGLDEHTTVSTIEHAMAALTGLGIHNVLIDIDGPEVPIMLGSSTEFLTKLEAAGLNEQDEDVTPLVIKEAIHYKDEATGSEISIYPSDKFEVQVMIDFKSTVLGHQYAKLDRIEDFKTEIAPCRTFVFLREIEQLLDLNLIKGGDLDNALVVVDKVMDKDEMDALAQKLGKTDIEVKSEGILSSNPLKYDNEPARHKLLDLIGDLTLVGKPIQGKVIASKPGHTSNVAFAKNLRNVLKRQQKNADIPTYDPSIPPVYDVVEIANRLPHRYPFLLVDKIITLTSTEVVGVKNVTFNEHFFQGHFPDNPVMPGVLIIEALAQTGGILALSTVTTPENWDTYFLKIDKVKFKRKVVPGDTLVFKMKIMAPPRRGIFQMEGKAYVNNKLVTEGELTAQIVDRTT